MTTLAMLLTAFGLAIDCTAVAAARGMAARRVRAVDAMTAGAWFGGAHVALLLAGALLGARVSLWLHPWDHWLAFVLLAGVGVRALWEARAPQVTEGDLTADAFRWSMMFPLALATSVDALAVGVTLPIVGAPIGRAATIVGCVVFASSATGAMVGRRLGASLGRRMRVVGGMLLIGLAVKLLVEGLAG